MTLTVTQDDFDVMCRDNALYLYFRVAAGLTATTLDIGGRGEAFADYDPMGHLVGVEFLGPCSVTPRLRIGTVSVCRTPKHRANGSPNGHKNGKRKVPA